MRALFRNQLIAGVVIVTGLFAGAIAYVIRSNADVILPLETNIFVRDSANVIPEESERRMNMLLGALLKDTDIELAVISTPATVVSLAHYATDLFHQLKIGSRTRANRGLLLIVSPAQQNVRFEVSYELEAIFPDAFVSFIEHEQMAPYFEKNFVGEGIEATNELIARRGFEKILGKAFDPKVEGPDSVMGFRSGGAGAETTVNLSGKDVSRPPITTTTDVHGYFSAQPNAQLAWERFLELNSRRLNDPTFDLYDDSAKALLSRRPYTPAAMDHIFRLYTGKRLEIRIEDDRAAVVFPDDPNYLLAPWFFRKNSAGWQFDGSMFPDVISYNHLNQWRFKNQNHAYRFAFKDYTIDRSGFAKRHAGS